MLRRDYASDHLAPYCGPSEAVVQDPRQWKSVWILGRDHFLHVSHLCYESRLPGWGLPDVWAMIQAQSGVHLVPEEGEQQVWEVKASGKCLHAKAFPLGVVWALVPWWVASTKQPGCQLPGLLLVTSALAARSCLTSFPSLSPLCGADRGNEEVGRGSVCWV